MGRIVVLVLSFGLSCLLLAGLLGFTEPFVPEQPTDTPAENLAQILDNGLQENPEPIQLPARIPGTDLVAERLVCYEGPFIEDGSDVPVKNIAALSVRNAGSRIIGDATVTLERAGERYDFYLSCILPNMSVLVLESSAAPYFREGITGLSGLAQTWEECAEPACDIQIEALDMARISATNLSNNRVEAVTLFHKNYLPDGTFVGGITYMTFIGPLEPGQTAVVTPDHYAEGYSKIYYIR